MTNISAGYEEYFLVYMEQPPRYVAQRENMLCKLKKAIYGLKQSPEPGWFDKFSRIISEVGF